MEFKRFKGDDYDLSRWQHVHTITSVRELISDCMNASPEMGARLGSDLLSMGRGSTAPHRVSLGEDRRRCWPKRKVPFNFGAARFK